LILGQSDRVAAKSPMFGLCTVRICIYVLYMYVFASGMKPIRTEENRQTERQTNKQTDRQTDRHTDRQT